MDTITNVTFAGAQLTLTNQQNKFKSNSNCKISHHSLISVKFILTHGCPLTLGLASYDLRSQSVISMNLTSISFNQKLDHNGVKNDGTNSNISRGPYTE